jgi:hypothetical protein
MEQVGHPAQLLVDQRDQPAFGASVAGTDLLQDGRYLALQPLGHDSLPHPKRTKGYAGELRLSLWSRQGNSRCESKMPDVVCLSG